MPIPRRAPISRVASVTEKSYRQARDSLTGQCVAQKNRATHQNDQKSNTIPSGEGEDPPHRIPPNSKSKGKNKGNSNIPSGGQPGLDPTPIFLQALMPTWSRFVARSSVRRVACSLRAVPLLGGGQTPSPPCHILQNFDGNAAHFGQSRSVVRRVRRCGSNLVQSCSAASLASRALIKPASMWWRPQNSTQKKEGPLGDGQAAQAARPEGHSRQHHPRLVGDDPHRCVQMLLGIKRQPIRRLIAQPAHHKRRRLESLPQSKPTTM